MRAAILKARRWLCLPPHILSSQDFQYFIEVLDERVLAIVEQYYPVTDSALKGLSTGVDV
jgi:hypothetical protein